MRFFVCVALVMSLASFSPVAADDVFAERALAQAKKLVLPHENRPLYQADANSRHMLHYPAIGKPNNLNGCTLGFGIHIASLSEALLDDWIRPVLGESRTNRLKPALGKFGTQAWNPRENFNLCKQIGVSITRKEAIKLAERHLMRDYKAVMDRLHEWGVAKAYNACQVGVFMALRYQTRKFFELSENMPFYVRARRHKDVHWQVKANYHGNSHRRQEEAQTYWQATRAGCPPGGVQVAGD